MMAMLNRVKFYLKYLLKPSFRRHYYSSKEHNRLKNLPRFTSTTSILEGRTVHIPDAASYLFIKDEMFNKEIYKFNTNVINPLIIDCGANIGLSLIYFKKLFKNSRIIAFEPDPKIFGYLKKNVSSFGLTDVQLINAGLWDQEVELAFSSEGADAGRINLEAKNGNIIKVKTTRLSNYLSSPVDFLKIDIEGAEIQVLNECRNSLQNVSRIFVEYHSFSGQDQKLDVLLSILKQAGFRYYVEHIGISSAHPFQNINTYSGMDLQLNIYGYRK